MTMKYDIHYSLTSHSAPTVSISFCCETIGEEVCDEVAQLGHLLQAEDDSRPNTSHLEVFASRTTRRNTQAS